MGASRERCGRVWRPHERVSLHAPNTAAHHHLSPCASPWAGRSRCRPRARAQSGCPPPRQSPSSGGCCPPAALWETGGRGRVVTDGEGAGRQGLSAALPAAGACARATDPLRGAGVLQEATGRGFCRRGALSARRAAVRCSIQPLPPQAPAAALKPAAEAHAAKADARAHLRCSAKARSGVPSHMRRTPAWGRSPGAGWQTR